MIRNVIAAVVVLALGVAGWSVWHQLDRPVRSVKVEGPLTAAEQAAIQAVVSERLDQGVLSLDLDELGQGIRALSWPRAVAVRRAWPDGLVIRVEKESVVAAWGDGGYLTSAGKVVSMAEGGADVPTLSTSLAPPRRAMEVYQMLASRLATEDMRLARLDENALGEWRLTLERGITVELGNEALGERLDRFLTAWRRGLSARGEALAHVDTRYGNGLAVRWNEENRESLGTDYALR